MLGAFSAGEAFAMSSDCLLALDQGTSSSRALVFGPGGDIVALAQRELQQHYPRPGWVEHDPGVIWRDQLACARDAWREAAARGLRPQAVGISNQRETTVLWDRASGEPLHRAIVWQDRRTEPLCAQLRAAGADAEVRARTGLVVDPYFAATKLKWLLDTVPGARARAVRGELAFGTIDSWLLWMLSGGAEAATRAQAVHATDISNAGRTLLWNIHRGDWDDELLRLFDVPRALLPQVHPSSHHYATSAAGLLPEPLPIGALAGDQQAALFGQGCVRAGQAKNTYGTGCFLLLNTGGQPLASRNGLLTTPAASAGQFALEGSVFVGGAVVQWLRDGLHAIGGSGEVEALARSVPDSDGVLFVPAFTGLGAPYWRAEARGLICGISRGTTVAHLARAALESIAFQSAELVAAMDADARAAGAPALRELRVDGGASANDLLMQFQADLLGIDVLRPAQLETTARGAAWLAGLSCGVYSGWHELEPRCVVQRRFVPDLARDAARARLQEWQHAVRRALAD